MALGLMHYGLSTDELLQGTNSKLSLKTACAYGMSYWCA